MAPREDLPRKQVAAGCIFEDDAGRVLLVKPTYKPSWELPGGACEAGESPAAACRREVMEELALDRCPDQLLGVDYRTGVDSTHGDGLRFVFHGGEISPAEADRIALPEEELSDWRFVAVDDLDAFLTEAACRRVRAFLGGMRVGYLEEGLPPEPA